MWQTLSLPTLSDPAGKLEDHYELLDAALCSVSLHQGLDAQESGDLRLEVHQHLLERDYLVLRTLNGNADIRTYLYSVITRRLVDFICLFPVG